MHTKRLFSTLAVVILAVLSLTACRSSATGDQATTGPMNERDRMRAEQWADATSGLDFESSAGVVAVQRIPSGNAAIASLHLAKGEELLGANRVMDALGEYGLAVRNDPDLADAYIGMGVVMKRKGKLDYAVTCFRTAVDRDDDNLDARYALATALWADSRQDEAIVEMNAVVEADEEYGKAHERLAVWNYYTENPEAAWEHLHRAEALGEEVPAQIVPLLQKRMADPGVER